MTWHPEMPDHYKNAIITGDNGDWHKLYGEGWTGLIVPEAFAHPAKYSRALIRHIYQHLMDEGWLEPGATVLDPFAGVALGALHAMKHGLNWVGVELEQKFVDLGQQNIDLWNNRFSQLPGWGSAVILQGDSRRLAEVVGGASCCLSSPPYAQLGTKTGKVDEAAWSDGKPRPVGASQKESDGYGTDPANLGNMPAGELDAVVASPPYAESLSQGNDPDNYDYTKYGGGGQLATSQRYGATDGQLAALPEGEFEGVVSSPPWEESLDSQDGNFWRQRISYDNKWQQNRSPESITRFTADYGDADGQLGLESGNTFWSAAKAIVRQVYQLLAPGSPAVWVVKAFVRNGERVDFPDQWRRMCESVGFETVHLHRAWLVEDRGSQFDLFGELHHNSVERKSFFRRLAERKGSPRIDWEVVLCQRKPQQAALELEAV